MSHETCFQPCTGPSLPQGKTWGLARLSHWSRAAWSSGLRGVASRGLKEPFAKIP